MSPTDERSLRRRPDGIDNLRATAEVLAESDLVGIEVGRAGELPPMTTPPVCSATAGSRFGPPQADVAASRTASATAGATRGSKTEGTM